MRKTSPCSRSFLAILSSFSVFNYTRAELPEYPMTLADMEVLAGYYTADGKYLGGIPKPHALSREVYECTDYVYAEANSTELDATSCAAWSADESYGGGFQLGTCECKFYSANDEYCTDWLCDQDGQDFTFCQCDDDEIVDGVSENALYCDSWSCKQISSGGRAEYEEYHCQRSSPSGHYCEAWNGNVTASDEFEVVTCECIGNWRGDQVCSFWECEELGISTCNSGGDSWCHLGVSVGVGGGLGLIGVVAICDGFVRIFSKQHTNTRSTVRSLFYMLLGLVWCFAWSSAVVIWGGEDGATYVGIMWGAPVVLTVATVCCANHYRRNKDEQH